MVVMPVLEGSHPVGGFSLLAGDARLMICCILALSVRVKKWPISRQMFTLHWVGMGKGTRSRRNVERELIVTL